MYLFGTCKNLAEGAEWASHTCIFLIPKAYQCHPTMCKAFTVRSSFSFSSQVCISKYYLDSFIFSLFAAEEEDQISEVTRHNKDGCKSDLIILSCSMAVKKFSNRICMQTQAPDGWYLSEVSGRLRQKDAATLTPNKALFQISMQTN